MHNLFASRADYRDYCEACVNEGNKPWPFRMWFETSYYYDMVDAMPTSYTGVVDFTAYRAAMLDCQDIELISSAFTESMGWVECYSSSLDMSFVVSLS